MDVAAEYDIIPSVVYERLINKYPIPFSRDDALSDYLILYRRQAFGEKLISMRAFAKRWGWSHSTARQFIMAVHHFNDLITQKEV